MTDQILNQAKPKSENNHREREPREFEEKVITISRVSKKTKGGNKMGFSALMVVGDKRGRVGLGLGKANDVQSAVRKGAKKAKKQLITVPMAGTTIPFAVRAKLGAGRVLLKPAPKGSGVIAGGPVRALMEAAGIRDISSKILGGNPALSAYATFRALEQIEQLVKIKGIKLKSISDIEREEAEKLRQLSERAAQKTEKKLTPPPAAEKSPKAEVKKVVVKPTKSVKKVTA